MLNNLNVAHGHSLEAEIMQWREKLTPSSTSPGMVGGSQGSLERPKVYKKGAHARGWSLPLIWNWGGRVGGVCQGRDASAMPQFQDRCDKRAILT